MVRPPRSLKARALQLLAQRDQSRLELRRKLLRHARKSAEVAAAQAAVDGHGGDGGDEGIDRHDGEAEVDALLDWLVSHRFLCDERFVESRIHAREARFGNLRIRGELARHGVAAPPELLEALAETELARAAGVRERRFAALPQTPAERAAQCRFLAGRGFSPEVIHRLMRSPRRCAIEPDAVG